MQAFVSEREREKAIWFSWRTIGGADGVSELLGADGVSGMAGADGVCGMVAAVMVPFSGSTEVDCSLMIL